MKPILLTICLLASIVTFGQTKDSVVGGVRQELPPKNASPDHADQSQIFVVAEQSPEYPGGMVKLMEFIKTNLKYPPKAEAGVEGKVYVAFVVETDGSLTDIVTIKGLGPEFDKEAERVIGICPKWNPGKQNGKLVRVKFVLPVSFKDVQPEKK